MKNLIRFLFLLLATIEYGHADVVTWAPGKHLEACTPSPNGSSTCTVIVDRTNLWETTLVVDAPLPKLGRPNWLQVASQYRLCAVGLSKMVVCEELGFPVLQGLTIRKTLSSNGQARLRLETSLEGAALRAVDQVALLRHFSRELATASRGLQTKLKANRLNQYNLSHLPDVQPLNVTARCDTIDQESANRIAKPFNRTSVCGDDGEWIDSEFDWFGGAGAAATGGDYGCQRGCTALYGAATYRCGFLPLPAARAICYGASMAAYSACLASC